MDISGLISSFSRSTYTVTRKFNSKFVRGRAQDNTTSTVTITASIWPATSSDLLRLPEGRRTEEARILVTTTQLLPGGPEVGYEADSVSVDSSNWEVSGVETWLDPATGTNAYRCLITRTP